MTALNSTNSSTFSDLGLAPDLLRALQTIGYTEPTPIQAQAIPPLIEGRDLIGQASTGTGKTAAFALPLLEAIDCSSKQVQAIVLTPTRELAVQVTESITEYAQHLEGVRVLSVYGGQSIVAQLRELRRGVQIVVGTPGRVMDHLRRKSLSLETVRMFVLDEADEMLRMGFVEDVEWILAHTPEGRHIALFSATMPREVLAIANRHLRDPRTVAIGRPEEPTISEYYLRLDWRKKFLALHRLLLSEQREGVLVFVRTRQDAADLSARLVEHGHRADALHGDVSQPQREAILSRFKDRQIDIVVGTDVAARGLDVDHITHVVNYDVAQDVDTYTHRIGRTGRAGRAGTAILFVTGKEMRVVKALERAGRTLQSMEFPTAEAVEARAAASLKADIRRALVDNRLESNYALVKELVMEGYHMTEVAAAAAFLAAGPQADAEVRPSAAESRPPKKSNKSGGRTRRGQNRKSSRAKKRKSDSNA